MARRTKKLKFPLWLLALSALALLCFATLPKAMNEPERSTYARTESKPSRGGEAPTNQRDSRSLPQSRIADFDEAKRELRRLFSRGKDIYCGCSYDFSRNPNVDPSSCGLKSKADRAKRIEWEHVVPASFYGKQFSAWKKGDPSCRGRDKRGRECARKVSADFRQIEGDMYNLLPAVGELNRVRGDKSYGLVPGEPREYGACDFETLGNLTEPKADIRGDIARIYFYMDARYNGFGIVNASNQAMLEEWAKADPLDAKEEERLRKIEAVQGNSFFIGRLARAKRPNDRS